MFHNPKTTHFKESGAEKSEWKSNLVNQFFACIFRPSSKTDGSREGARGRQEAGEGRRCGWPSLPATEDVAERPTAAPPERGHRSPRRKDRGRRLPRRRTAVGRAREAGGRPERDAAAAGPPSPPRRTTPRGRQPRLRSVAADPPAARTGAAASLDDGRQSGGSERPAGGQRGTPERAARHRRWVSSGLLS